MFSLSYRRAVSAEAAGDYVAAARAYALSDLPGKAAEMHLCEAGRQGPLSARWRSLQDAAHFASLAHQQSGKADAAKSAALLSRVAQAYLALLRLGVHTDWDRMLCREAALIAQRAQDPLAAAAAFELLGDDQGAANALRDAGELERMEAALAREEQRWVGKHAEEDHAAQAELCWTLGQRDAALQELRAALASAAEQGGTETPQRERLRRRLQERDAQVLTAGRVTVRCEPRGGPVETCTYAGTSPLWIGRGAECHLVLRDNGISRKHACIKLGAPGTPLFLLSDQGSRNGTTLNQVPIAAELPLRGEGEVGIGEHCALTYQVQGAALRLAVRRGMDRGLLLWASAQPLQVAGAELRFVDGRPLLSATGEVRLNDKRVPPTVQLARGDTLDLESGRLVVLA